jgi:hypothetical protein
MRGLSAGGAEMKKARALAAELEVRDAIFPNILDSLRSCLSR